EHAKALRAAGNSDAAKRVAALRKPSLMLWALNQAGAVATDDLDQVRSAGDRVRAAQEQLLRGERDAASEMQSATQAQRRAIDTLTRRLGMVLTAAGHAAADDTLRRISDALRAASTGDDETWATLRDGRLTSEPEPAGLPVMDAAAVSRVTQQREVQEADVQRKRLDAAEADVQRAEQVERSAREQADAARQRLQHAIEALDAARASLAQLREQRGAR
ncbi:MAG TPA: hypothetical protein VJU79_06265, partial [Candidatus Dormibacteraeota bacterium]|nr:hypothetical protein [Candidatus Dormibacteraeota bacterium]